MPTNRQVINQTIAAYANAGIDAAYAAGGKEAVVEVRNQMIQVIDAMSANIALRLALDEEGYTPEQREDIAKNVFEGFHPVLIELLQVMSSRCDVDLLRHVHTEYEELIESKLNFNVVDVTTVVDLDDNLRSVIKKKAEDDLGRECVLVEHIDTSIMGGIIMSTKDRYVDASVRSQLDRARIVLKEKDGGEC